LLKAREKKVLDVLAKYSKVKDACTELRLTPRTVYNILYRLRKKYFEARRFVNQIVAYRHRSELIDKVLSRRLSIKEEVALKRALKKREIVEEEKWEW
jgi:hypothetical protein